MVEPPVVYGFEASFAVRICNRQTPYIQPKTRTCQGPPRLTKASHQNIEITSMKVTVMPKRASMGKNKISLGQLLDPFRKGIKSGGHHDVRGLHWTPLHWTEKRYHNVKYRGIFVRLETSGHRIKPNCTFITDTTGKVKLMPTRATSGKNNFFNPTTLMLFSMLKIKMERTWNYRINRYFLSELK